MNTWTKICLMGVTFLVAGCGAKTGLYVDDAGPFADVGLADSPDAPDAPRPPCIEVPFEGQPVLLDLLIEAEVGRADIAFLIDRTASMGDEIGRIRSQLRDQIAPAIRRAIPDSQLGVATFADFPVDPYGGETDVPFELRLAMTDDLSVTQTAVNAIELSDGRDVPESQVEGLYQLITGEGLPGFVPPSPGCPRGGRGYACVRSDALPVILLFTDNAFHNGPGNANPYVGFGRNQPHRYAETVLALVNSEAVVIGFDSGDGAGRPHLNAIARDTGALVDGAPLVYDIGVRGERLGTSVVEAIETFAGGIVQDVDAQIFDPDPGDGVDVRQFVERIVPLSAEPMSGVLSIDREGGVFVQAQAGTLLRWQLILRNGVVVPGDRPQSFRIEVRFRADGRRRLRTEIVTIVIPSADGVGCEGL